MQELQNLDKGVYWEVIIHPSDCVELFADFIMDEVSCAIEYLDIQSPFALCYDMFSWHIPLAFEQDFDYALLSKTQPTQIVLRIEDFAKTHTQTPLDSAPPLFQPLDFIQKCEHYAIRLACHLNKSVTFCYHVEQKRNCDWIKVYEDSIAPVVCGCFHIFPPWHSPKDHQKLIPIIINPALAFGSGHHASTRMCLELLSNTEIRNKHLLDVGCGSGILSIAAAKLGARVYACDTDEFALQETRKNAAYNDVGLQTSWLGSISASPPHAPVQYDVIVANIIAFVVKLLHDDFVLHLKKGGILILSGILDEYKSDIIQSFSDFTLLETCESDGWFALKLTFKRT